MFSFDIPPRKITRLTHQPDFPNEDLTEDNAEMLKYLLAADNGLDSYSQRLAPRQRQIYEIARKAVSLLSADTSTGPKHLESFSHGFAGMEIVTDIVHERPYYPNTIAAKRVAEIFIDTRSTEDIAIERELLYDENDLPEGITENGLLPRYLQVSDNTHAELPPSTVGFFIAQKRNLAMPAGHDRPSPEKKLSKHQSDFQEKNPNTTDVIIALGENRRETMSQLQMRLAGASLARTLQVVE